MPVPAPPKPHDTISRMPTRWSVLLGDEEGNFPDRIEDEIDWLKIQEVRLGSGADRLDTIICTMDLELAEQRLIDLTVPIGYDRVIEIRKIGEEENGSEDLIIAWGRIVKFREVINRDVEQLEVVARLDHHLIGGLLQYYHTYDVIGDAVMVVEDDIVFNPVIDDKVESNLSSDYEFEGFFIFVDPESMRTTAARSTQGQAAQAWYLHEAVYYICKLLFDMRNLGAFTLPDKDHLFKVFENFDEALFKNVRIPLGSSLPSALDKLLKPFGYSWYPSTKIDKDGNVQNVLEFFELGKGTNLDVYLERPGNRIDNLNTNLDDFSCEYSVADLTNQVAAFSKKILREGTFELHKGWDEDLDVTDLDDLKRENLDAQPELRDVGRKWVLNEAGDYTGLRTEITQYTDLTDLLGDYVVKRRKLETPVTRRDSDANNLITVDWMNPETEEWEPVKWSFSILERECGIYIEGDQPPEALWDLVQEDPSTARIRVTASIRGDSRTWTFADKQDSSPNGQVIESIIDLSSEFDDRAVLKTGSLQSKFKDDPSDEIDPESQMELYSNYHRDRDDAATVNTSMMMDGIDHTECKRSCTIGTVNGRNLILDATNPEDQASRKLQIVGINYRLAGEQRTELILEKFDRERL